MKPESFIFTKLGSTLTVMFVMAFIFFVYSAQGGTFINITLKTNPTLEDGLVGHWTFDGKDLIDNVADKSGSGNTGYLQNFTSTTTAVGRIGQALEFDGVDDYISIDDNSSLNFGSGTFSLSAWVNIEDLADRRVIINKDLSSGNSADTGPGYLFFINAGNNPTLRIGDGTTISDIGYEIIPNTNQWYHFVAVRETDGTINWYADGIDVEETVQFSRGNPELIGSVSNSAIVEIGKSKSAGGYFDNFIDDVRIYNRALSADEVTRLYKLGATTKINKTLNQPSGGTVDLSTGLIGHWTFDGKDMYNNVADISGQGNDGALSGQTSTTTVIGKISQALEFDGIDDYVDVGNDASLNNISSAVTVAGWIYVDTTGSYNYIFSNDRDCCGSYNGYSLRVKNSDIPSFKIWDSSQISHTAEGSALNPNQWYHLSGTYDGDTLRLYVDGVEAGVNNFSGTIGTPASFDATIGALASHRSTLQLDGKLDDVRIYNRALSADEVTRLYKLGATTKVNKTLNQPSGGTVDLSTGLVGHWTFDGPDMLQNVADRSNQGNTGYLTNFNSTTTVIGTIGQALEFDGVDDYVNLTNSLGIQNSDFSFSHWIKTVQTDGQVYTIGNAGAGNGYRFGISGGRIEFLIGTSTAATEAVCGSTKVNDGEWHLITGVFDRTDTVTFYCYVDGNSDGSTAIELYSGMSDSVGKFGKPPCCIAFVGSMDDVRIYNRALSADEVTRLYKLGGGR